MHSFALYLIFLFILNCLGLQAYQTCQTVYLREGKTCFPLTKNNVMLLFSKDTSYEGIIFDKSFICNFVLHFSESHTNISISIQSFTCHHTAIQGQKFYINLKILPPQLFITRCSVHLPIISSLVQCEFSSNCYAGFTVTYLHFC